VRALSGAAAWFGDSSDPAAPVRSLAEEAARWCATVLNPWIGAMRRHGYRSVRANGDRGLLGYDATARAGYWMYERVTSLRGGRRHSCLLQGLQSWALRAIAERLLEAHRRGMWQAATPAQMPHRRSAGGRRLEEQRT
jgi:cobaltochelatase CobN